MPMLDASSSMDGRSEFGMGCVAEDYVFVWNGVEIRFCGGFLSTDGGRGGSVRLRLLQSTANSETPRRRREENSIPNVIEAKGFLAEGGGLDGSPAYLFPSSLDPNIQMLTWIRFFYEVAGVMSFLILHECYL
ncbi:uncharacterized protein [Elaeis guineensis]|uniref:uncharacterized protein isoform X2 n=1 Tax=Elaeis guineensis var. tenera TaxID=51953 RepID=UPI003C6D3467